MQINTWAALISDHRGKPHREGLAMKENPHDSAKALVALLMSGCDDLSHSLRKMRLERSSKVIVEANAQLRHCGSVLAKPHAR
ncbi:hypothetical protein [Pseudomonas sp. LRF_L74]|uniref:hypothetical protein n=1 Tax=Pseudomonas sp. LRF_L74 TaxID=3369422 RepID=UPI003F632646